MSTAELRPIMASADPARPDRGGLTLPVALPSQRAGFPGKRGLLSLRLARSGPQEGTSGGQSAGTAGVSPALSVGRTVLRGYRHRAPLQVGRVLYPDDACPDMAYCYVAMITGGLVQGDRLLQHVHVAEGARAHVTTLAATKVYGMEWGGASQRIALSVAQGGVLEWWPDPVIPFRGARLRQTVTLRVHPESMLLYGDLLLPGRTGFDERHDYAFYRSRVTAYGLDGQPIFVDTQAPAPPPPGARLFRETLPPGLQAVGTVYLLAAGADLRPLVDELRATLDALPRAEVLAGCSLLPGNTGLAVRLLAADGNAGRRAVGLVRTLARRRLLGVETAVTRKL